MIFIDAGGIFWLILCLVAAVWFLVWCDRRSIEGGDPGSFVFFAVFAAAIFFYQFLNTARYVRDVDRCVEQYLSVHGKPILSFH